MNSRLPSLILALGLGLSASLAAAETAAPAPAPAPGSKAPQGMSRMGAEGGQPGQGGPAGRRVREKPESFTEENVRKMADGRVFKRQIEQKVGDGVFTRKEVMTNPDGKSASRTVTATLDKEKKTWTRKIEGVDFDGTAWTRSNEGKVAPHDEDDGADEQRPQPRKGKKGG